MIDLRINVVTVYTDDILSLGSCPQKNKTPRCVSPRIGTNMMMVMRGDTHHGIRK
ncbi:MAG TPA: hypothetical protein VFH08_04420 [Chitinophagaceae bacterium]|nr:hypothetical protein [Chitinophagaceae bacterium]